MTSEYKYAPIPDEPRYRKKSRKVHVRSDHKHDYETVCVDAHGFVFRNGGKVPYMHIVRRCKTCGRIGDVQVRSDLSRPVEGMPLYEVESWAFLWESKSLPEGMRVEHEQ